MSEGNLDFHWSRVPGKFVDKRTGEPYNLGDFEWTGTVREWYETLVEVINDVAQSLPGDLGPVIVTAHPDVAVMLECSYLYHPNLNLPSGLPGLAGELSVPGGAQVYALPSQPRDLVTVARPRLGSIPTGSVRILDLH